jgi:DNA polymerase-3 subunit gamma/tau
MSSLFATDDTPAAGQDALFADMAAPADVPPHYRVLARKYRPINFDQLIGQDAMVRTLSNAIESGRLPHAWMLTGVRGIGKTTTARIIARALNCTGADGKGGATINPCGVCDSCKSIAEDRHVDVLEMDAASRTGVDDIRDIIDGVRYGPVSARYKIYILDEVHMLTKNAFNALLKTLEEPPAHTKFIFATTEIRKVPVTVLSRCQRFDLRRIDSAVLAKHFADVAVKENAAIDAEAVRLIAHAADGSVRDGLSLLDQAIARGNANVTADDVKDMLGLADRGQSLALCRHLMRGEMKAALDVFTTMQQAGSDPLQVLQDMCELVHLLTRGQVINDFAADASLPEYDQQLLTDLSDIKIPALARAWQILLKGINEVQSAMHPAQAAEMVLIRMAYAAELPPPAELIKQLRDAENVAGQGAQIDKQGGGIPSPSRGGVGRGASSQSAAQQLSPAISTDAIPQTDRQNVPTSFKELVALFAANREGALHAQLYNNAHLVRFAIGVLEIRLKESSAANFAGRVAHSLTEWTGTRWMVSIAAQDGEPTLAEQDRAAENNRHDRALADPVVAAVIAAFPGAKLSALRQKAQAVAAVVKDDAVDDFAPMEAED